MVAARARILRFDDFATPGSGCHVARAKYRPGDFIATHGHDFAEVFWVESGRGVHRTPEARGDLSPGFLCLIAPGDEHEIRAAWTDELVLANVAFPARDLAEMRERYAGVRGVGEADVAGEATAAGPLDRMRTPGWLAGEAVAAACSAAFSELGRTNLGRFALHRFLLEVLVVADRELDSQAQSHRLPSWLGSAIDEAAHDTEVLSAGVTGLASCAGRSADHLNRTCRRYLQTTASGLVNRMRLDYAEHLLQTTHLAVTDVAFRSGFENLSYFYRRFRERHGVPPSAYRARAQWPVTRRTISGIAPTA